MSKKIVNFIRSWHNTILVLLMGTFMVYSGIAGRGHSMDVKVYSCVNMILALLMGYTIGLGESRGKEEE